MRMADGDCVLGVIGGSGLYDIPGLEDLRWVKVDSPFGAPSDDILTGRLAGRRLAFLPRHGRGHRISPSALNFRANIDAMKRIGCTEILSVSAVGCSRRSYRRAPSSSSPVHRPPRARKLLRRGSGRMSMEPSVCNRLGDAVQQCHRANIPAVRGSISVMEGRNSRPRRINLYRRRAAT
jgi:5'-methylthioadenosine phosphorylase